MMGPLLTAYTMDQFNATSFDACDLQGSLTGFASGLQCRDVTLIFKFDLPVEFKS
jgi:hypothetical protein